MRLKTAIDTYIEEKWTGKDKSKHTERGYSTDLGQLADLAKSSAPVSAFDRELVKKYFARMRTEGLQAKTQLRRRAALSSFAKYCLKEGLILEDPMLGAPEPKELTPPKRNPDPFQGDDRDRLDALKLTGEDAMLYALLRWAGLRAHEASNLTWPNVRLAGPDGRLGRMRIVGKGSKERLVPILDGKLSGGIGDELDGALRLHLRSATVQGRLQHPDKEKRFVVATRDGSRVTERNIGKWVARWGRLADVEKVHPHRFRHTCCTMLFERGVDARVTQKFMGHESLDTTMLYTNVVDDAMDRALRAAGVRAKNVISPGSIEAELSDRVIDLEAFLKKGPEIA